MMGPSRNPHVGVLVDLVGWCVGVAFGYCVCSFCFVWIHFEKCHLRREEELGSKGTRCLLRKYEKIICRNVVLLSITLVAQSNETAKPS